MNSPVTRSPTSSPSAHARHTARTPRPDALRLTSERRDTSTLPLPGSSIDFRRPARQRPRPRYVRGNRGNSDVNKCDYRDAINNRKAWVNVLVHEPLGGVAPFTARRLRRFGRESIENGNDATDYTRSYTARSFVPYYSQQLSNTNVMMTARAFHDRLNKDRKNHVTEMRTAARGG